MIALIRASADEAERLVERIAAESAEATAG